MKKRFSEEQIVRILKEADSAGTAREVVRKHNVSEQTFYRRKQKYGGMEVPDVVRMKELSRENTELKQLVAELTPDHRTLRDVNAKTGRPAGRCETKEEAATWPQHPGSQTGHLSASAMEL